MEIDPARYVRQLEQTAANLFLDNQRLIALVSDYREAEEMAEEGGEDGNENPLGL